MANAVLTKVRLTMVAVALALSVVVGGTVVADDAQARGTLTGKTKVVLVSPGTYCSYDENGKLLICWYAPSR